MKEAILISDLRPDGYGIIPLSVATCAELRTIGERALRVWIVLACRANDRRGGWAWSITALSNDTGIDRRNLQRAIAKLEEVGLIVKEPGGGRASTFYRLTVPPSLLVENPVEKTNRPTAKKAAAGAAEKAAPASADSAPTRQATVPPRENPTIQDPPNPPQAGGIGTTPPTRAERVAELMRSEGLTRRKADALLERQEGHLATWESLDEGLRARGVVAHPAVRRVRLLELEASGFLGAGERYGPLLAEAWRSIDEAAVQTLATFGRWKSWGGRRYRDVTWIPPGWRELEPWALLVALDRALAWASGDAAGGSPGEHLALLFRGLDTLDAETWTHG